MLRVTGVSLRNPKFKSLNGLFYKQDAVGIELRGCGAACEDTFHVYPNSTKKDQGFGKKLCKMLAKVTGTCVKASEAIQKATVFDDEFGRPIYTYRWGSDIRTVYSCAKFEELTGQVWVFKPDGNEEKLSPVQGK